MAAEQEEPNMSWSDRLFLLLLVIVILVLPVVLSLPKSLCGKACKARGYDDSVMTEAINGACMCVIEGGGLRSPKGLPLLEAPIQTTGEISVP